MMLSKLSVLHVLVNYLDGIKNLGYYMAFKGGLSFNLGDIIIPKEKRRTGKTW